MDVDNSEEYAPIRGDPGEIDGLITMMREYRSNVLDTDKEFTSIAQAEKVVLAKELERSGITGKLQDELDALTERYNAAHLAAQRPSSALTSEAYETRVLELEGDQYASGKALNEEANDNARREAELTRARGERDDVKKWDPSANVKRAPPIQLQLFATMGFQVGSSGQKILVRNDGAPDVHVVELGGDAVETANRLWDLAG